MAGTTPSGDASTRWLETSRGVLTYAQLAPLLAERVVRVQERLEAEGFAALPLGEELLCALHAGICADLMPEWAGRWRTVAVTVGPHTPPPPHEVPLQMREYALDLTARLEGEIPPEQWPEILAFAEGRLLSIHPFADFNGRIARLWLWELLRRHRLPPVELAPSDPEQTRRYLEALRAGDQRDWAPLAALWRWRFERKAWAM